MYIWCRHCAANLMRARNANVNAIAHFACQRHFHPIILTPTFDFNKTTATQEEKDRNGGVHVCVTKGQAA